MDFLDALLTYEPRSEQERIDRIVMLDALQRAETPFLRENLILHFTASAWITNRTRDKVLMIYHNIYDSWAWTGGHADGERDLLAVALKEAREETGLTSLRPVNEELFSIETLTVNSHIKRGAFVPSHLHMNGTYLLEADENEPLTVKEDENSNVAWFPLEEAVRACTEPWMCPIYEKLNKRIPRPTAE